MNNMKYIAILVSCLISLFWAGAVMSSDLPDGITKEQGKTGKLLDLQPNILRNKQKRFEEQLEKPQAASTVEDKQTTADPEKTPSGPTFELKSVRFSKSQYLSQDDLSKVVRPLLETQVSFSDLNTLVLRINQIYRENNVYTATATLPPQKIKNGVVYIRLIEGSLGKLVIEDNHYLSDTFIRQWLRNDEQVQAIDIQALEADVLRYNRVNDQRLQAELHAGTTFGLTDIVIRVDEPKRDQLYLFWDNYGVESTGKNELGILYSRQKLFMDGDRGSVHVLHSGKTNLDFTKGWDFFRNRTGIKSLNLGYSSAVLDSGWRLSGTLASTATNIIGGDLDNDSSVEGQTDRISLDSSYLALSDDLYWLNVLLGSSYTWSQSSVVHSAKISELRISQAYAGAQINLLGDFWQISLAQYLNYAAVENLLVDPPYDEFSMFKGDFSAVARVPGWPVYGLLSSSWQHSPQPDLAGALTFSTGGSSSVRGYEPGFANGDDGYTYNIEAHYNGLSLWQQNFDFYLFHDGAKVEGFGTEESLVAVGLGMSVSGSSMLAFDMTAAQAQISNSAGKDDWQVFTRLTCQCL